MLADNTRSRGDKPADDRADAQREASPRLYDFAARVGIRRAEYAALRGSDFGEDAVGAYVLVRRGKTRELAQKLGLPVGYDRLCTLAVSVLHLAHWRLDVTVDNYLLAQ